MTGSGECGCVPGHRMMTLSGACEDCGLTEQEVAEGGNRPCDPTAAVLRDLARAKAAFQLRAIVAVIGAAP